MSQYTPFPTKQLKELIQIYKKSYKKLSWKDKRDLLTMQRELEKRK